MITRKRIRVLVVDDSILFRTAISRALEQDPQLEIVGTASNAYDARDKLLALKPDVMTLDVEMPGINGIEFLATIMPKDPLPVIVLSSLNDCVFEAMRSGAVDFVRKPEAGDMASFSKELAAKIKIAAISRPARALRLEQGIDNQARPLTSPSGAQSWDTNMLVAIGASTGGTEATSRILKELPEGLPGILITQHMPPVFTRMYAQRLDRESRLTVSEAKDGERILPGHVYVAPGDAHMRVVRRGSMLMLKVGGVDKVAGHCPSVDVLFESVAQAMGDKAIGILLTGMGADGARGMLRMKEKGAYTIGQDQQTSVVYGMPMQAMKLGAVTRQAALDDIPNLLLNQLRKASRM